MWRDVEQRGGADHVSAPRAVPAAAPALLQGAEAAAPVPPDPGLVKLVEALARAQACRDHAAELAARKKPEIGEGPGVRLRKVVSSGMTDA